MYVYLYAVYMHVYIPYIKETSRQGSACCFVQFIYIVCFSSFLSESSNAPDGDLYPAEAVEASITPLLAEHGVPISYVYNALAARHDLHRGHIRPDCTHFGMDGVMYLNEQVLKTAAKVIEKVP